MADVDADDIPQRESDLCHVGLRSGTSPWKLGLLDGDTPDYSLADVKDEFNKTACPIDLDGERKAALLDDALSYLDGKGYCSFRLHLLCNG